MVDGVGWLVGRLGDGDTGEAVGGRDISFFLLLLLF